MKNYFRYGYDPWMLGMTIVILIVEALGFFLGGESAYDPFANIPFWLLTLYIISMIAMFLTACFIINYKNTKVTNLTKSSLLFAALITLFICLFICMIIRFFLPEKAHMFCWLLPLAFSLMTIAKKKLGRFILLYIIFNVFNFSIDYE